MSDEKKKAGQKTSRGHAVGAEAGPSVEGESRDRAEAEAMGAIKLAMVTRRDRSILTVMAVLLCAAYVALYTTTSQVAWAVADAAAGILGVWFGVTAASALQRAKAAVTALDAFDAKPEEA
jgi:hypothetical protein